MTGRCNEVEQAVNTVVSESGVTLDSGLLGNNVVVLSLNVFNNLAEAGLVVNLITEAGCVDDGQGNSRPLFIKFEVDGNGLDLDTLLDMGISRVVGVLVLQHVLAAECVHEGGASWKHKLEHFICPTSGRGLGSKRGLTSAGSSADHQAELDSLLEVLLATHFDLT